VATTAAARLSTALLDAIEQIDDSRLPIAEVARRVCAEADARGTTRPSYERIRQLVHLSRERVGRRGPSRFRVFAEAGAGLRSLESTKAAIVAPRDERR